MMEAALRISLSELSRTPLKEFGKPLQDKFVALKVVSGQDHDGTKLLLEHLHHGFSLHIGQGHFAPGSPMDKQIAKRFKADWPKSYLYYEVVLWDYSGTIAVYSGDFYMEESVNGKPWYECPPPKAIIDELEEGMTLFVQKGQVSCSDCGKPTDKNTRHYFAGRYCPDCWSGKTGQHKSNGGWQAIEARETYN